MTGFLLDPRLAADTLPVATLRSGPLLLMNDRRWPWLILVPAVAGAVELHGLAPEISAQVNADTVNIAAELKRITGCTKINTGALGNIVRQLHVHIVARSEGDPNWPGPVWGFGAREPWPAADADRLIERVRHELN
jgi:diadenosine tetraphosphate (Ap4A) HIT family hydrolase